MLETIFALLLVGQPAIELPPTFMATGPNLEAKSGRLLSLSADFAAKLSAGGQETSIPSIFSLRRFDRTIPPLPTGPQLISTYGDRILGKVQGGDSHALLFLPKFLVGESKEEPGETWKVPFSSASVLWLTSCPADLPIDPVRYLSGNRNRDFIQLRNGDLDRGSIAGLEVDAADVRFSFRSEAGGTRAIHKEDLAVVAFNPTLARTRKPKGPYVRLVLADSSRLHLANVSIADGRIRGETLFGARVSLPISDLLSLDVLQGNATYLADLQPRIVEQTGFLGVTWPWMANRTVRGSALRIMTPLGDSTFDSGIGTHPRTILRYDLDGKYHWFDASVGLDPSAKVRGEATVRIKADGVEQDLPSLAPLKAGLAVPVRINIQGAKELILITDFGAGGGVGAEVNWCDARLMK